MIRETAAGAYVRVTAPPQREKSTTSKRQNDSTIGSDATITPVWLQAGAMHGHSAMVSRNAPIVAAITNNSCRSHAIDTIAESKSLHQ